MLPKERVAKLLDNGLSKKPLMLHGTSLESLLVLFNTGTLSPGRDISSATRSYLYFSNVQKNFAGKKYSGLRGVDYSEALEVAKSYAQINAEQRYVTGVLISEGMDPKWADKAARNFLDRANYKLPKKEQHKFESLDESWLNDVYVESKKRKGVILEADECILERKLSPDPDDAGIRVFCPEGLHANYFRGIRLLGPKEKETVRKYVGLLQCCQLQLDLFV